jgi:hypothetical protein
MGSDSSEEESELDPDDGSDDDDYKPDFFR